MFLNIVFILELLKKTTLPYRWLEVSSAQVHDWLVVYIRGPALCLSKSLETCKLHLSASDPNHKWQLWLKLMSPRKLGKPTKNQWGGVISVHLHLYDIVYQNSCNVSLNLFNLNIFSVIFAPLAYAPAWCILFFLLNKEMLQRFMSNRCIEKYSICNAWPVKSCMAATKFALKPIACLYMHH